MKFRITVRGTDMELRGYVDGPANVELLSRALDRLGMVVASPLASDLNPHDGEPSFDASASVISQIIDSKDGSNPVGALVQMHYMQAMVIRNERHARELAEKELRDRELHHFETEQLLAESGGPGPCARCGRNPAAGYASIYEDGAQKWYCHGDDDDNSCYEREA